MHTLSRTFQRPFRLAALAVPALALVLTAATSSAPAEPAADATSPDPDALFVATPPVVADYFPVGYEMRRILPSGRIDADAGTVTLPLHRGRMTDGRAVWYVVTDASDRAVARRMGVNWSPKLANAPADAVRTARLRRGGLVFDAGTVNFRPERVVVPGEAPNFFPPAQAQPGSVGDDAYSPLVRVVNQRNVVLNATVVAFDVAARKIEFPAGEIDYRRVIDRAVAISPANGTVTLTLNVGTTSDRPILFISLDSNDEVVSALEATTYAPRLAKLPVGRNDAGDSAVSANYIIVNGPTGTDNPQRQGLNSALGDAGAQVLDIFDGAPGVLNGRFYSPMWDLYVAVWSDDATADGHRARIGSELEVVRLAREGALTGPDGGDVGPSGLISNCPLIAHF